MEWNKTAITVLIEAYSEEPALFDVGHTLYHNKHARKEKLLAVAKKVSVVLPGVTGDDCKIKFNSLRSHYGAEVKKIKSSEMSGCSSTCVYKPGVWWFKYMSFLKDHITPRRSCSNVERKPAIQSSSDYGEVSLNTSADQSELQEVICLESADSPLSAESNGAELLEESVSVNMSPQPIESELVEQPPQRGPYSKKLKRQRKEDDLFQSAINVLTSIGSQVHSTPTSSTPQTVTFGQYIDSLLSKMDNYPRIQSKVKWGMLEVYKEGEEEIYNTDNT